MRGMRQRRSWTDPDEGGQLKRSCRAKGWVVLAGVSCEFTLWRQVYLVRMPMDRGFGATH